MKPNDYAYRGPLQVNPWPRRYLSAAEAYELAQRAKALGVSVNVTGTSARGPFHAEIVCDGPRFTYGASGRLPADAIIDALDAYEEAQRLLADDALYLNDPRNPDAWSPEELVLIAAQSGLDVSRG